MRWLLAACGSALFFLAASLGTFVPLRHVGGVEYLFAAPRPVALFLAWLCAATGLAALYLAAIAAARSIAPDQLIEARSGRWLAPFAASGIVTLGIAPALPGVGERGAVIAYLLYDLRWWWMAVLAIMAGARLEPLLGRPAALAARRFSRLTPAARLLILDTALFVGVIAWAYATTAIRFDSTLHGDEPKYVRYLEAWYQGQGLDISAVTRVRDQPLDATPALFGNVARLTGAVAGGARRLSEDLRGFARDPSGFRWNRALGGDGSFLTGIHGGVYQVHLPGVSAFLFPGYFVDRYLLNVRTSPDGRWPADLAMTNLMMLLVYGVCSVVLFRLLRNALGSESLAWIWAAVAMITLPTTAFAFQLYPEIPALLIILAVSNQLLFGSRTAALPAALAGAAAGALGWLHIRFLVVCLCLVATALFTKRERARWAYVAGFGLALSTVLAFNYHVTGSWWPSAIWEANGRVRFDRLPFVLIFWAISSTPNGACSRTRCCCSWYSPAWLFSRKSSGRTPRSSASSSPA
jgi:hypothetical protein